MTFILAISSKAKDKGLDLSSMEKLTDIQANGKMICSMVMASLSQTMALCMKASLNEERNMVMVS